MFARQLLRLRTVSNRTQISTRAAFHRTGSSMAQPVPNQAQASPPAVTPDGLKAILTTKIEAQHVEIEDLSGGCGQAFQAIIVSPQFEGKTMLARHRLVNSALKAEIAAIHAWTPKCYTPEQWQKAHAGQ